MIPARFAPLLFNAILSGLMTLIVSAISTIRIVGLAPDFAPTWLMSWGVSWATAFPIVAVIAPLTGKLVAAMIRRSG